MNEETRNTLVEASRPVRWAAAAALGVLALFLLVKTFDAISLFGQGQNPQINTITVSGTGKSTATPDIAKISFTVQESAADVKTAQDAATKRANAALDAMKKLGISDKDITTSGYNIMPQYGNSVPPCGPGMLCPTYVQNSNTITGYQVSESVDLTVRDTAKASDVVAKLGSLGVQNVSGPNFTFDDENGVLDDARANAIKNAHDKAVELAKELGVSLAGVVSYSDQGGIYPNVSFGKGAGVSADSVTASTPPQLPVGQQERDVSVQVTYRIK